MKKTMLTYKTIERFERDYVINYTEDDEKKIDYCAYVANIGAEGTEEEIFKNFLRVMRIENVPYELRIIHDLRIEIRNRKNFSIRSAWDKGVTAYADDFLDNLAEAIEEGYFYTEDLASKTMIEKFLLNGAEDWAQYSWGGCSLIYDYDIAKRLCNPTELKRTHNGRLRPNRNEEWLDVQRRALYQASTRVIRAVENVIARGEK